MIVTPEAGSRTDTELNQATEHQPQQVQTLLNGLRFLLPASWSVSAIAYPLPQRGIQSTATTVVVQVGYTVADLLAKPLFGLLVLDGTSLNANRKSLSQSWAAAYTHLGIRRSGQIPRCRRPLNKEAIHRLALSAPLF